MDWMFDEPEYVPDYSAHVRAAYYTRHDGHVKVYKDTRADIAAAARGMRIIRPRLVHANEVAVQPMTGPVAISSLRSVINVL